MRIITGLLKGRAIPVPKRLDVRPTTDRVKEGLFSVIESRRFIRNTRVLDLYAGTGNLGFEALSRGAASVLFVDKNPYAVKHITALAQDFDMEAQANTAVFDVPEYLSGPAVPYDIIFADPPYTNRDVEQTVETILTNDWLAEDGWLVFEHNKHHNFEDHPHFLFHKTYGRTYLSFFYAQPVNQP